ncbi:hypothetical protein CC78DRAFT_588424 [Lojkania enalia]|uniref:Uncharacterized protein n=1 Tax=Lojkania enalia TaxID=147567 RepID=A0A9P4JZS6_9PLEO|nr:hypothetical protein CC78DRAFT_588424 [Didymosphaeria enalia]
MCTKVVHQYSCGHQIMEKAPCATSKGGGNCTGVNTKIQPGRLRVTRSDKSYHSVPPQTLSGRHLMAAGGAQMGVKNRNAPVPQFGSWMEP